MPNYSRYKSSITNNTRVFSIMNGLAPRSYSGRINSRATKKLVIPADPEEGLEYMKKHNILSKNPACSGGVGRINTTACTSKDGLFMSVAPRNYQYRPLYNHIYKSNDPTTHHLPCDVQLFPRSSGVTVGKISDQWFYASGVPKVTENMFMCDTSSNNPEPCTTDLSHVYAFNIYSDPRNHLQDKVTTDCSPGHWEDRIATCYSERVCAQQMPSAASTITIEDASGLVGILAILSIDEYFKPIAFTRIDLSGIWEIPEISMNIYYPTTIPNPGQPYFNILPGADITNKAHITVMNNYLHTTLFQIAGSFTNYGTIKYASDTIIGIRDITFFDISGSEGKLTNAPSGNIKIPDISGSPTSIKIFNAENGATFVNDGGNIEVGNITTSSSQSMRIFNILSESTLENDGNITIDNINTGSSGFFVVNSSFTNISDILIHKINNSGSGFYFEKSFFKHTSGTIGINKITNKSVGIKLTNHSQLSNEASILIGDISNESYGLFADNSPITNKHEITLGNISNESYGLFADNSPITNTSKINTEVITHLSWGFQLTNGSILTNNSNINFDTISNNGMGIVFTDTSILLNDGPITLGTINNGSSGFFAENSKLTNTSDISLGEIQDSWGFHLTNVSTLLNNNNITLGNISGRGMGIQFTNKSTLSNDGPITLGNINNGSHGFFANDSSFSFTNKSDITLGDIISSTGLTSTGLTSTGLTLTNASTLLNHGAITGGFMVSSYGVDLSGSIITNNGPITLGKMTSHSSGFFVVDSSLTNTSDISLGEIQDSTGFHLTNGSNLTNNSNINFDTIIGNVESVGLLRDPSSSIINNISILFTEISGKAVGVVAEIHSILPHEIMGGYGKIDVSNINYQDKTNPYTYAFGKRGIALTRALMDNAVEFTKNEPDSSSNYCPSSHPYAYMEFENQVYGFKTKEISNDLNGTLKSKCCSVQSSVSGISHNWSGLNRKATTGIDYSDFDAANLSAVRQLATDVGTCGGNYANYKGWSANGAFSFRHVCPEGASHDPDSYSSNNTLQSMPGIPQAQMFSTKTMYSQEMGSCSSSSAAIRYCNKSFYSFGYGWKDLEYKDAWDQLQQNKLNKGNPLQANEKVYYLDIVNGTPFADAQDPNTTWLIQDFVGSADIECATACKNEDGCTSYSLIPTEIDGGSDYVTIQYYCVGRSDGYTDYKGVQGWGYDVPASLSNGASLPENWNAAGKASRGQSTGRTNYHYAQWCDSVDGTNWRPKYAPLAPLVGFVNKPPQVAPIINFNGSVNMNGGGASDETAAEKQYNALKNGNGPEKWCDRSATNNEFKNFKTMTDEKGEQGAEDMENGCLMGDFYDGDVSGSGCWDPDPDFGGCYKPSERNDGGVLSLEKMPAEIYPNTGKAEVDSHDTQGTWPTSSPSSEWLMNTTHETTPITHTTNTRPDITDIVKQTTPL